jgi:hypothetical protein
MGFSHLDETSMPQIKERKEKHFSFPKLRKLNIGVTTMDNANRKEHAHMLI